jgi:tetratricopeptide (TPR) repeat protein
MISTPEYSRRLGRRFILAVVLLGATAPSEAETGALLTEAKAALRAGDGIAAQARLREALRDGASPDAVRALMGEALLDQGDRVSARKWLAAARFTRETRGLGYRILGRLEQADGNLPAAGKAYDRALESDPSDPAWWSDIARLRFAGGELKGAIDAADHAVSIGQNSAPALTMRAVLVREQFGLRSSLPWFRAALSRAPNDPDLLAEYAATLGDMGRAREMLEVARRLVAVSPGDPRGFLLQAALAARAGNNRLVRTLPGQFQPSIVASASGANPLTAGFISRAKRARKALASSVASPGRSARLGILTTISARR